MVFKKNRSFLAFFMGTSASNLVLEEGSKNLSGKNMVPVTGNSYVAIELRGDPEGGPRILGEAGVSQSLVRKVL